MSDKSKATLRIAMSIVFLYFGLQQILSPDNWASFVPNWITSAIITANNIVIFNGILEISLGIFLLIGLYTRFASLILSLHLLGIALSIGINPIGVRDLGLTVATFVVFLNGADKFCVDRKFKKTSS